MNMAPTTTLTRFPLGFCEMGAGCWCSYNDRFIVLARDSEAMVQDTLGRGSCLIGYWGFQGGTQRAGTEMAGHPLSYDFQAPLGEFGFARESYHRLKLLHHFVNDYGQTLAPMVILPVHASNRPDGYEDPALRRTPSRREGFLLLLNDTPGMGPSAGREKGYSDARQIARWEDPHLS